MHKKGDIKSKIAVENINTFGSKMIITQYINNKNIDVYFPEYDWTFNHSEYYNFKQGNIKCPYERRTFDVGYLGEGKYKSKENGKQTKVYNTWNNMLSRCYNSNNKCYYRYGKRGVKVCEEWHNFQNFAKWYEDNYYEVECQEMQLDKDILIKRNKIYSAETCILVPKSINILFIKRDNDRGKYPLGVCYRKDSDKFRTQCMVKGKYMKLGCFDTPEDAFELYKITKEKEIKRVADEYKNLIPKKLYDALYKYKIEITD